MPYTDEIIAGAVRGLRLQGVARRILPYAPRWLKRMNDRRNIRRRQRLVYEDELTSKYQDAIMRLQSSGDEIGDYLEFGVYNGTSMACMYHVLDRLGIENIRLFGFDSFEGLPPIAATDSGGQWRPGAFRSSLEFTKLVLDEEGIDWTRVTLIKGWFESTLNDEVRKSYQIKKAGVIMIDCDLYQSAKEALAFSTPLIGDKCVMFFDDWFPLADRGMGEKRAFDEFLDFHRCFDAQELYDFKPWGKVFLVSRTG